MQDAVAWAQQRVDGVIVLGLEAAAIREFQLAPQVAQPRCRRHRAPWHLRQQTVRALHQQRLAVLRHIQRRGDEKGGPRQEISPLCRH